MAEIDIIVNEQLGTITGNFDEVKSSLQKEIEFYNTLVYTDDNIKDAKSDLADLRKMVKAIEDRRKDIKKRWNAPYDEFELKCKELVNLINKPINTINEKVEDYENRRILQRKKEIREYFDSVMEKHPDLISRSDDIAVYIYDPKWNNATTSKKAIETAVTAAIDKIQSEVDSIKTMNSDYQEVGFNTYFVHFSLPDAIAKMSEMQKQAEIIRQQERERAEREAAEKIKQAEVSAEQLKAPVDAPPVVDIPVEPVDTPPTVGIPVEPVISVAPEKDNATMIKVHTVNENQIKDIVEYINFMGISAEVVR